MKDERANEWTANGMMQTCELDALLGLARVSFRHQVRYTAGNYSPLQRDGRGCSIRSSIDLWFVVTLSFTLRHREILTGWFYLARVIQGREDLQQIAAESESL